MLCCRLLGCAALLAFFPLGVMLSACGPTREEAWNSYYYGADQINRYERYDHHAGDNDDTYVLPNGAWGDDQSLQGQKWR